MLGAGWHGRENGTWAWPLDGAAPAGPLSASANAELHAAGALELNLPCRWSGARASAYLLRPAAVPQLVIDAFVPPQAPPGPARVYVDGVLLAEVGGAGTQRWTVSLAPRDESDVLHVELEVDTHRPHAHGGGGDGRDLGLLVRRIALVSVADGTDGGDGRSSATRSAAWATTLAGLRCDPRAARAVARGWVLPGDGSPLSALAWLATWIDGSIAGLAPPAVARDPLRRTLVSALEGGRLEHEPGSQRTRWLSGP